MKRWFSMLCSATVAFGSLALPSPPASAQASGGKIAFVSSRDGGGSQIYVMNADGSNQTRLSTSTANDDAQPSFSRDGTKIVFASIRVGNAAVFTMNADGTNVTRLTNSLQQDEMPSFSPDGTKIVFMSDRTGVFEIYTMNADGTGQTRLTSNPGTPGFLNGDYAPAFSPGGTKILFESYHNNSYYDVDEMNVDGSGQTLLAHIAGDGYRPAFSPDGSRIVFGGSPVTSEVDVMNADGTGRTVLAAGGFNAQPVFSPDGRQVAFASDRSQPATTTFAGDEEVWVMNADATGPVRLTSATTLVLPGFTTLSSNFQPSWAPGSVGPPPVPAPPPAATLSSLSLTPSSVLGGASSQGKVTLSAPAPAGGAVVTLSSSNPALAAVAASVTVGAGATSASFPVTTNSVTAPTVVTLSASYGGAAASASLTVTAPAPPPTADRVSVQKVEYTSSKKQLLVEATGSSSTATLQVSVTSTGALIGTLGSVGGGKFQGQFPWPTNPQGVTVRSSQGGSASSPVAAK